MTDKSNNKRADKSAATADTAAPDKPEPRTIYCIKEYLEWVDELDGYSRIYRGLASRDWKIDSSAERRIFRGEKKKGEEPRAELIVGYTKDLLADVRRNDFHISKNQPLSELKILAKLQHDEAATCFIDFTYDPLIALWFACKSVESDEEDKNGRVISVDSGELDKFSEIPEEELEEGIEHFFERKDTPWKWQPPMGLNKRVPVQKSIFIFGRADIVEDDCEKIVVADGAKAEIRATLGRKYGVGEERLFPDYQGFVKRNSSRRSYAGGFSDGYYFRAGVIAHQRGDYREAIANYTKAIQLGRET